MEAFSGKPTSTLKTGTKTAPPPTPAVLARALVKATTNMASILSQLPWNSEPGPRFPPVGIVAPTLLAAGLLGWGFRPVMQAAVLAARPRKKKKQTPGYDSHYAVATVPRRV